MTFFLPSFQIISSIPTIKRKIKVGFNLLLWTSAISKKMNPVADKLKEIGFDGIEVSMGNPDEKVYLGIRKIFKEHWYGSDMFFRPWPDHDPISESQAVRDAALERMKWMIDRANELDAKVMCGPMHSAFLNFRKRSPMKMNINGVQKYYIKPANAPQRTNVIFAVEAINRFECYLCNTIDQLNKLVKLTNHPNIKPMYDTFHSNIEDKSLSSAIASLKGSLSHVHISENDRGAPGEGHIDFDAVFNSLSKINYSGWITIESFSRNDEGFANMMNVWRKFSDDWDVPKKAWL